MKLNLVFTAETHNFPTGVEPFRYFILKLFKVYLKIICNFFSGASTGTGGRIRDVQAVGRGGFSVAGTAAYCVGNLFIPGKIF